MNFDELREWIEELKDFDELSDELLEILEEMLGYIEMGEPDALVWARLLAKFIEKIGDKMPPVIRDFISLYAQALENAIDMAAHLGCVKYEQLRNSGASHEDAVATLRMDPNTADWCRLRWLLKHLPRPTEPTPSDPQIEDAPDTIVDPKPDEATLPPDTTMWAEEDDACCAGGGKDADVQLDWGTVSITPATPGGDTRRLNGTMTISHPCGILFASIRLTLRIYFGSGNEPKPEFFSSIPDVDRDRMLKITKTDTTWTIRFDSVGLSRDDTDWLEVAAVSKCFTNLPAGTGEIAL